MWKGAEAPFAAFALCAIRGCPPSLSGVCARYAPFFVHVHAHGGRMSQIDLEAFSHAFNALCENVFGGDQAQDERGLVGSVAKK